MGFKAPREKPKSEVLERNSYFWAQDAASKIIIILLATTKINDDVIFNLKKNKGSSNFWNDDTNIIIWTNNLN